MSGTVWNKHADQYIRTVVVFVYMQRAFMELVLGFSHRIRYSERFHRLQNSLIIHVQFFNYHTKLSQSCV